MTNRNIFNLTGITVPLVGTEVIPIWNGTTTTKIAVDDLTKNNTVFVGALIANNTSGPD